MTPPISRQGHLLFVIVHTRLRSARVNFKINRILTVQFVECMFYCNVMDRTMVIRAGRVIWTGCCSCTLLSGLSTRLSRVSSPREPLSLVLRHLDRQHCHLLHRTSYPGGPTEDVDRLREGRLQGRSTGLLPALLGQGERRPTIWTTSTWWTGRGARWQGRLDIKTRISTELRSSSHQSVHVHVHVPVPSKLFLRLRWFVAEPDAKLYFC